MSSVLRPVRKRKKSRKLGPVDVIRREDYGDLELDAKVELIRSLVPLGLMHVEEMLDDEVTALAGARYARKDASIGGRRHGSNPGTVGLAGQRVPIRVPRIRRVAGGEIPLRSYAALHGEGAVNDRLLTRVLYGISCRNYAAAAEAHRHAAERSSRLPYPDPVGPARPSPVCEQSRRSVSSTDPPPRAPDARLQIDRAPPTLRVGPRRRPESLSRRPAPPTSRSSPHAPHPSVRRMERGDVCFVSSRPSSDLGRRPGPRPAS